MANTRRLVALVAATVLATTGGHASADTGGVDAEHVDATAPARRVDPPVEPPPPPPPPPSPDCSSEPAGRAAIVDRIAQRTWLCRDGVAVTGKVPFTAGPINDAPRGRYQVFFKADPWWGGGYTLRHFTAFTRGDQGGRVAFHRYVAMSEWQVGTEAYRNASHGCFRMRAADAALWYSFLQWGDVVRVLNNG